MQRFPKLSAPLFLLFYFASCGVFGERPVDTLKPLRTLLVEEVGKLDQAVLPQNGQYATKYLSETDQYYPPSMFSGKRILGTIQGKEFQLGAVLLLPDKEKYKGTIIAFHGYSGYTALHLDALSVIAENGWAVLGIDLPGHGFTNGYPGDINEFSQYAECADNVLSWIETQKKYQLQKPFILLGHSTGGAAVMETLWTHPDKIDCAVLLAPLVKIKDYSEGTISAVLLSPFMYTWPIKAENQKYFSPKEMPLTWMQAYSRWYESLSQKPLINLPILILQGNKDATLDWEESIKYLKEKIKNPQLHIIQKGPHTLFNHKEKQKEALHIIIEFLNKRVVKSKEK